MKQNKKQKQKHSKLFSLLHFAQKISFGYCSERHTSKRYTFQMMPYDKYKRGRQHLNGDHQLTTYKNKG